ncbi:hypothetical protein B6U98_06060 [Thermoplasmatales archaeon ex4572_165]|nr:MAG: hypothetical protein B6U98_06060 [Thermoplasmatales archaeon ex4572_165]
MNIELKKIDAIIVVALIVISGFVLAYAGYWDVQDDYKFKPISDPIIYEEAEPEPIPPNSQIPSLLRAISPEDEGKHFHKASINREWWYYTAVFDESSELPGWAVSISFNHMAWGDLLGTLKPDLMIVTLHGPNGEEYGGLINKERGFGLLKQPTLEADTPGVSVTFEKSWAEGLAPQWHVHVEDEDIDEEHEIIIDLEFFAPSDPYWTFGSRALQKTKSTLASYTFFGCNVTGTVRLDGVEHTVTGSGYHEHTWTPITMLKGFIKEWDWCQITLDNGWNIYYSNYKLKSTILDSKETKFNPLGTLILTTDNGKTLTVLEDIDATIKKSEKFDDKIFLHVKMPKSISISAKPGVIQPLIKSYNIELDLNIQPENTYDKLWRLPTYTGMKIGRSSITGKLTWNDVEGISQEVELEGIGSTWSMRALV